MTSIHTLTEERRMFFSDLRFNKHRFIDFLGMMAKHHRHPLSAQIGLFFHGRAADEAYASPGVWESLRTEVRKEARGVPVLMGEEGQEEIGYLYDISDTRDPAREDLRTLLWHYDDMRDGVFLRAQLGKEDKETQAAVMDACRALAEESADEKERSLVALGAAYVTLSRLGLNAEEEAGLPLILTEYNDMDAEKTLTGIQRIAQRILGPVARHIREEARNHEKGNDLSGRTHPSLGDAEESGSDRSRAGDGRRSALERASGTIGSVERSILSAGGAAGISRSFSGDEQDPTASVGGAAEGDRVDAPRPADGVSKVLGRVRRGRSMGGTGATHEGVVSSSVGGLDEILREENRKESERIDNEMWGNPYAEEEEEPEDEVPFVPGAWARMRRRFLQVQRPQEWKRMLKEQEASAYLAQIEKNYQEEYLRICEREEANIPQEELTFLENVQRRNAIGQMVKEFLMEDLQH